ncbi:zinc finger CCCH domain-containing protein 41 [Abrus precatorius]|uniref:Zinc finger CCCH domain-containing protein 41 n=1 Tax=Abrus precatorius TaxID=3816 RepID=A0A8B8LQ86_ABRPR|nr:zinc finger CCCH domain-containing protein 41 [Abrus precatorius]XP_027357593.1 zinc finger CCCH domain-containing protein 41 [Abrus precatorius]XP_027357594.1 zinc finger CCCH domain-containing protein 41 [Abrus precatorius]XP_027357595.1 zinc finger CCCH domain-containing protein 41 [Abrus precatorius]
MELKVSSPKPESVAPSDCISDPEEKEVSDDDDDDRNHKHRRREARSQSLERDVSDPVISRPFRKRNKTFGNRHPFRENEPQAFEPLKTYSDATTDKELYSKFDRRRPGLTSVPRTPLDMNQRLRANQSFTGDPGAGRGRGRESGFWNQRESRFGSMDVASQMVQPGSIPPSLYTGRGLPNVSNAQNVSWNTYGLVPAVPNGGLDMLHPMGLQGTLRQPINSSLNVNITRQRCRDFEERGFCLRGDMCPMEHGVNRIVIEDVQSLSQFNLPVSLPSAHLIGAPAGSGSLHSVNASTTSMNNKCIPGKISKSVVSDDGLPLDGAYTGPGCPSGADLYDPDQPLWNDSGLESSNALLTLQSSKIDETEPISNDAPDSDCPARTCVSSQGASSSVWARIGGSKNRFDMKEKTNSTMSSFQYPENQLKEDNDELLGGLNASCQVKQNIADDADPKALEASLKAQSDSMRNIRKPSQKALRTLFVNGIPQKSNKRESLLAHFKKFGKVIDIYIPLNSERAFVQFSKREEAEAALKAPDAVMGNRFIKLWWANRDSIRNDSTTGGNGVIVTPRGQAPAFVPSHQVVSDRGKDIHQADASKTIFEVSSPSDQPRPVIADGPKVPPLQKKLENIEHLKEELRKKQEMLDQKRNEFRRQLNKLEKQATGLKGEVVTEQAAKRPKTGPASDVAKLASPQSSDADVGTSPHAETTSDKNKQLVNTVSQSPRASTATRLQESTGLKHPIQPLMPVNRYKLDNRPVAFRIIPPLPAGLANVAVLKEHFLPYGELSAVELEDVQVNDSSQQEAHITFATRRAAERAFINGKSWKEHNLKFMWLSNATGSRERSLSAPKEPLDTDDHSEEKLGNSVNQEAISGEHKNSETQNGLEPMEMDPCEDPQCTPRQVASDKQSPEGNGC